MLTLLCALLLAPGSNGTDWPQYRGPDTNSVVGAAKLPESWSASSNLAWTARVASGWSQPIVVGGTIFVTEAAGAVERPIGMEAGIADPSTSKPGAVPDKEIEWRLVALDLASGKEKWSTTVRKGKPDQPIHRSNTWATETPVADQHGVYAYFGMTGTLAAYDHAGKALWKVELGSHPIANGFGTGSSPVIHEGKIYVQSFAEDAAFVACFDTKSGKELWRQTHETPGTSWASPLLWRSAKRTELVTSGQKLITGRDLATGKELWHIAGLDGPGMCSFAADEERLYFGQRGPGSNPPLYALSAGQTGDLSPAQGSRDARGQAWLATNGSPSMSSPVSAGGLVYVGMGDLLTCRDAATGEPLYEERVPDILEIAASPIVVGERLLLLGETGHATWVPLGPEFEPKAAGEIDDLFWTTPVVAGDALLLRGLETIYCIRK